MPVDAAGSALSRASRSQVGHRTSRTHPPQLVSPPPIPALRDLTTTGALVEQAPKEDPAGCREIMLTSMASALLTNSQTDDARGALRSCRCPCAGAGAGRATR